MQQLMKRLEIMRAAISLEDEETIALHRERLVQMADESVDLCEILNSIDVLDYPDALQRITDFLNQHVAVAVYNDPEVSALKMELQGLERRLTALSAERDEILHVLEGFNHLYNVRLGGIISAILRLHMLRARAALAGFQGDAAELDGIRRAHEQAQNDYQQFNGEYEGVLAAPGPRDLSPEGALRLKNAYRKASRLCHPDMVAEELKELATAQFQALHQAYNMNDVDKVEEILAVLQAGGAFVAASEQVQDKDRLRAHISSLRQQLDVIGKELQVIQKDSTWILVEGLNGDYEPYLAEQEADLDAELTRLRQEYRDLIRNKDVMPATD